MTIPSQQSASNPPSDPARSISTHVHIWIASGLILFVLINVAVTCLRQGKPEWLTSLWLVASAGWLFLCLYRVTWAAWLIILTLPVFGARPGDLATNLQDTWITILAAASIIRYPIRLDRLPRPLAAWAYAAVGLLSLIANADRCFESLRPVHQDALTHNVSFMFAGSWDLHIGISEWFMLVQMLLVARLWAKLISTARLSVRHFAGAVGIGLTVTLLLGFLEYWIPVVHDALRAYQLRIYDFSDETVNRWALPSFLRSPAGDGVTMKSFFGNRGWFGEYLIVAGPITVGYLASTARARLRKALVALLVAALVLAVILCGARAAAVAAVGGTALLAAIRLVRHAVERSDARRRLLSWSTWILLVLMIALPQLLYRSDGLVGRFNPHNRHVQWAKAMKLVAEHPWLGVGYETFGHVSRDLPPVLYLITAHNSFAQVAACMGVPGLICLLLMFRAPLRALFGPGQHAEDSDRLLWVGMAWAFLCIYFASFAQHWFYLRSMAMFWWIGLALLTQRTVVVEKAAERRAGDSTAMTE